MAKQTDEQAARLTWDELPEIMEAKDVGAYLGIPGKSVYSFFKARKDFPLRRLSIRRVRIFKADFRAWLDKQREEEVKEND